MRKWCIELQEYWITAESKESALKKYKKILRALSKLDPITPKDKIFTDPQLDEYVSMFDDSPLGVNHDE